MILFDKFTTPGVYPLSIPSIVGNLEVELTVPPSANWHYVAILGHPHSLQGGTMNNKVVTTLVRAYKERFIPCIRFNFRGVGQSDGEYDAGIGESEDMLLLARLWKQAFPTAVVLFSGFSFGSYVAYRAAAGYRQNLGEETCLITIAPSVHHYDYNEFDLESTPWVVVQGDEDEVVPAQLVYDFASQAEPALPVLRFENTGHFFHGKLIELKTRLIDVIDEQVVAL
ncbi:MAG: hypothetical protein Q8R24_11120 [Legionellaceae bacterium]|nr:hypothetical protein [Legionellaceae bacterium]